jgi:NAD(P)-dependent dehydrogenase (short-subunit alcohol dehydrogenase family)
MNKNRVVVVVGCSRGIGFGIVEYLSTSSACSFLVGVVRRPADLQMLTDRYGTNPNVMILQGDVTSAASMENVVEEIKNKGLIPDLLVCNAGILTPPKPFDKIPIQDFRQSIEVNLMGPFYTMRAFLPLMRNVKNAVIVNVSSGWGLFGSAEEASYCASKHGLEGLMKCAAEDVSKDAVSIVTVRPGIVHTDMLEVAMGPAAKNRGIPVDKFAGPFCEKIFKLTKEHSGTHIDCSYEGPIDW